LRATCWRSSSGLALPLILILTLLALGGGLALLHRHTPRLRRDLGSKIEWGLLATVAGLGVVLGYLFIRAIQVTPDGWLAQYNNTWSDWSFHASYATAFVYGHNLPPQNPIFSGTPFRYPFAPDFASALLIAGGWSIPAALIWPSWAMTLLALTGLILWGPPADRIGSRRHDRRHPDAAWRGTRLLVLLRGRRAARPAERAGPHPPDV